MDREIPKREKRKAMIKSIVRYGVIILGAVLLPIVVVNSLRSKLSLEYRIVAEVDRGAVQMTVSASGILVALNEEIIVSPIGSRILEVYKCMRYLII